jgi:hypothetical protein
MAINLIIIITLYILYFELSDISCNIHKNKRQNEFNVVQHNVIVKLITRLFITECLELIDLKAPLFT